MILVMSPATYLPCMQAFSTAGNSSPLRLHIEDQQLQTPPLISIIDDDESMSCAVKSLVTSLVPNAYTFASAEEFLRSPNSRYFHDRVSRGADAHPRDEGWGLGLSEQAVRKSNADKSHREGDRDQSERMNLRALAQNISSDSQAVVLPDNVAP